MIRPFALRRVVLGTPIVALLSVLSAFAAQGEVVWFRFKKAFVQASYPTQVAFGTIDAGDLWTVGPRHGIGQTRACGGKDGEAHVGVYEEDLPWPVARREFSFPVGIQKVAWGLVVEPPNVTTADMTFLNGLEGQAATFQGYLRVWNEGHYDDEEEVNEEGSSNPNHIFELHPAWRITVGPQSRDFLVFAPPRMSGYGLSKFRDVARRLQQGDWLKVYQTSASVYVSLLETSNFFTLPVVVRATQNVASARRVTVDVCNDRACSSGQFVTTGLRAIVVPSAEEGTALAVGETVELLGFFSVNLRSAMEASTSATKKSTAVPVPSALEFFVFGRAKDVPVRNSSCQPDTTH